MKAEKEAFAVHIFFEYEIWLGDAIFVSLKI